jgi:redox-sensing transcriptional repressor
MDSASDWEHKVGKTRGLREPQFLLRNRKHGRYARLQVVSKLPIPLEGVEEARNGDRLTVGVAARLSQYLRVLTQARKMGKERISSQEISEYTNINATQIRRDLSGFGKFGKRGVGYNIDALAGEIRKILRTQGQHNIALFGAGRLGQAIASSTIFADHGFNIAAAFDVDPEKVGKPIGQAQQVLAYDRLSELLREKAIIVAVLAVPDDEAQRVATDVVEAGVKIIFNYTQALLDVPSDVTVHTTSPAVELLYALYFYLA